MAQDRLSPEPQRALVSEPDQLQDHAAKRLGQLRVKRIRLGFRCLAGLPYQDLAQSLKIDVDRCKDLVGIGRQFQD